MAAESRGNFDIFMEKKKKIFEFGHAVEIFVLKTLEFQDMLRFNKFLTIVFLRVMVSTVLISMNATSKSILVTMTLGVTTLMVTTSAIALRVTMVMDLFVPILTNALIPIFLG